MVMRTARLVGMVVVAVVGLTSAASAQTSATERADALNEQGKELFKQERYLEAYKRFREAAQAKPEGRFFFNMCYTLNFLERYQEAISACDQVEIAGADAALLEKTHSLRESIRQKVPASLPPAQPVANPGTGHPPTTAPAHPGTPTTPTAGPGPVVHPDAPTTVTSSSSPGEYKWSLGGEIGGMMNLGIGDQGMGIEHYGGGGHHVHLFANFIISEPSRLGLQGFVNFSGLSPGDANVDSFRLNMLDVGGAVFQHRPLSDNLSWSPLAGVFLSLMKPQETLNETLLAVGLRGEVSLAYSFGSSGEHTLAATPALNIYSPASGGNSSIQAQDFGLDQAGAALSIAFGYQYRFSSPVRLGPAVHSGVVSEAPNRRTPVSPRPLRWSRVPGLRRASWACPGSS